MVIFIRKENKIVVIYLSLKYAGGIGGEEMPPPPSTFEAGVRAGAEILRAGELLLPPQSATLRRGEQALDFTYGAN